MEKISCFLTLNHTHLSQPYIKSIDFLRDEGENKQNMLIFVSGCSTPLKKKKKKRKKKKKTTNQKQKQKPPIACIFTPLNIFASLENQIGNSFNYIFQWMHQIIFCGRGVGVGWRGQKYKKPKMPDFAIFVLIREVCRGRASDGGGSNTPMSPLFFFSIQRNTEVTEHYMIWNSLIVYMAMLLLIHSVWYFKKISSQVKLLFKSEVWSIFRLKCQMFKIG